MQATVEAPIHDNIKRAIVETDVHGTTHVMRSLKNTERVYKNTAAEKVRLSQTCIWDEQPSG